MKKKKMSQSFLQSFGKNVKINILKDRLFAGFIILFSILSIVPLILILYYIFSRGIPKLTIKFLTSIAPVAQAGTDLAKIDIGGVAPAIIGTLLIVFIGSLLAIPFGVIVGIFLAENRDSKLAQLVLLAVDMIQGIPSIIFGIVINLWIVTTFKGYSGFAGSIALALMMLPIVIKNTEETIKLIPHSIKEAAVALGTPYYKVLLEIVLPIGLSGIVTGILVGMTRVAGETAPLLFTAGYSGFINWNMSDPMGTLPVQIYKNSLAQTLNLQENAWGASAVLVIIVLLLNLITKWVVNKWKIKF